jgi:imidazole glycerol-phosphate synthase subunit HisH
MKVIIIDYGMGNIHSVISALNILNISALVSSDTEDINQATHLILPGVGGFSEGMNNLRESGLDSAIIDSVNNGSYLLGVCLGMQLLADQGIEGGETNGLGLIGGNVIKLNKTRDKDRIPHVGWNEVIYKDSPDIFNGISTNNDFYFVHSYHFKPISSAHEISTTNYCDGLISCVNSGRVWGVQFHPEKSSKYGLKLLRNFVNL